MRRAGPARRGLVIAAALCQLLPVFSVAGRFPAHDIQGIATKAEPAFHRPRTGEITIEDTVHEATRLLQAGALTDAEALCRETLAARDRAGPGARLFAAAELGDIRLIDNISVA